MINEEAIKILANFKRYISGGGAVDREANEAIDMAISALKLSDSIIKQLDCKMFHSGVNVDNIVSDETTDIIYRQAAIDEIEYELEMINSALDSITLDFNARERLRQRRGEAREILNSIQQLPSAQPDGEYISRQAVTESDLIDWYINSVDESEPVWTEEHIHELFNDFYLIPKED